MINCRGAVGVIFTAARVHTGKFHHDTTTAQVCNSKAGAEKPGCSEVTLEIILYITKIIYFFLNIILCYIRQGADILA